MKSHRVEGRKKELYTLINNYISERKENGGYDMGSYGLINMIPKDTTRRWKELVYSSIDVGSITKRRKFK